MIKLNVLYEDNHLIVVEKPANILSQSDITKDIDMLSIVKEYVKNKYHKPGNVYIGLVHRLDRPVGGLMVFARTSKAAKRLSEQIKNHQFKKSYLAVVRGVMDKDSGEFVDYLKKNSDGKSIISNEKEGKYSCLNYEVLKRNKENTLVKIDLQTGRHHQIRLQFSSRGYPLCGDQRYCVLDKTMIALYAYQLSFLHPITKERLFFELMPKKGDYFTEFKM